MLRVILKQGGRSINGGVRGSIKPGPSQQDQQALKSGVKVIGLYRFPKKIFNRVPAIYTSLKDANKTEE